MGAVLDLSKAFKHRQHGDLLAIYTWFNDERALILLPAYRKNAAWFIILEPAAWKYDNPHYLAHQAVKACEVVGIEPSTANWRRIANIIIEGLPDLIEMPSQPDPVLSRATIGEMKLFADGQLLGGEEIRLEVETGATYG